jgi:hypothetical protein
MGARQLGGPGRGLHSRLALPGHWMQPEPADSLPSLAENCQVRGRWAQPARQLGQDQPGADTVALFQL